MRKARFIVLLIIAMIAITACSNKKKEVNKEAIFVSLLPQKDMVNQIVGYSSDIQVLVPAGASPATYEPTTKQMSDISKAKVLFTIGVPFEKVLIPKLKKQLPDLDIIATDKGIEKRKPATIQELMEADGHHHAEADDHHHGDNHGGVDPHIWLDPTLVIKQVQTMTDYLVAEYPEFEEDYRKGSKNYINELNELDSNIQMILRKVKGKSFLCFHPSWGYFADRYGLKQVPIEIEGKEPTPKEQKMIIDYAIEHGIKTVFVQKQFNEDIAKSIAEQINGKVVSLDPLGEKYLDNMMSIANKIAISLK